ncbi:hypothetical protein ACWD4N_43775, partial [Streptomyces sp. NPDC002586]
PRPRQNQDQTNVLIPGKPLLLPPPVPRFHGTATCAGGAVGVALGRRLARQGEPAAAPQTRRKGLHE